MLHGENGPSTCLKNSNNKPIDGLFCGLALSPIKAGHGAANEGCPSDHAQMWADFVLKDSVGEDSVTQPLKVDRLNVNDPRSINECNDLAWKAMQELKITEKLNVLDSKPNEEFTEEDQQECNHPLNTTTQIRMDIRKK